LEVQRRVLFISLINLYGKIGTSREAGSQPYTLMLATPPQAALPRAKLPI
jgi:hypothetical protein